MMKMNPLLVYEERVIILPPRQVIQEVTYRCHQDVKTMHLLDVILQPSRARAVWRDSEHGALQWELLRLKNMFMRMNTTKKKSTYLQYHKIIRLLSMRISQDSLSIYQNLSKEHGRY
jgi:hypothetical protein